MSNQKVDLNCDMGEGADDSAVMEYVSSVNIACGFHAGNATIMRKTVRLAIEKNVAIGAHPSFFDREGFGRQKMNIPLEEVFDIMVYQMGALKAIVEVEGGSLSHVKPHGALYNMAAKDAHLAETIASAIVKVDKRLVLYGPAASELIKAGKKLGLKTAEEVFVDRTYQDDGTLTPREDADAFVTDASEAAKRALQMVQEKRIIAQSGEEIFINAETICIHGDSPDALGFAREVSRHLKQNNIIIEGKLRYV